MRELLSDCRPLDHPPGLQKFVTVENVGQSFGSGDSHVRVLDGVSIEVREGELCVIVGASGSGKSTLLNAIGGLDRPESGQITVGDTEVTGLSNRDLTRYRRDLVGFVFQFYNLIPNLTVRENIGVCQHLTRDPLDVDALMDDLGLTQHQRKFPAQLSGGQQQRCAIARALVKRPRLLLCDEPTGALDYDTSRQMLQVLDEVNHRYGSTLIIVTHNEAITRMADQVVEIKDGRVLLELRNASPSAAADLEW